MSAQTVRNWVASGRLAGVRRGARTMIPRDVVITEIERSDMGPRSEVLVSREGFPRDVVTRPASASADPTRPEDIYGWMERARRERIRFPLDEYNARIPNDLLEAAVTALEPTSALPAPWSEHFRPATADDVLSLLSDAE